MIYHVSKSGSDFNKGTVTEPFLTIQKAADMAISGDTVVVHEGVYREWVKPRLGGHGQNDRITYMAAEGEHVVIKGSEIIKGWELVEDTVWKVTLDNRMFGEYNPYATEVEGDWLVAPRNPKVHTGDVYLNGASFFEATSYEKVLHPERWEKSIHETWGNREEKLVDPDASLYRWYATVGQDSTVIYANFHGADPNNECVEINVRRACFFPERTGIHYITVRGFEMAQAATTWAPPTSLQYGIIGPYWSKGWIIENNIIHDSKCSGISLGKEGTTGDNEFRKWMRKPGYQYQMEAVFKALAIGWSKETVGSHIVRNNVIYDCGQNGVVGHLGSAFCEIYGNEIYRIGTKHEYYGHELGGIKLHGAIDTYVHHNYIHHCTLGTWLDWQIQGIRVSSNVYANNNRDFFVEVTHGPYMVDHNVFTAEYTIDNAAQGGAFINNIIGGFINHYPVHNRPTPYHFAHSTMVAGVVPTYGGDDRWFQNIFVGGNDETRHYGTEEYDGSTTSIEEYSAEVQKKGFGYIEHFEWTKQPAYINRNVYLQGAKAFDREEINVLSDKTPEITVEEASDGVYLNITLPEEAIDLDCKVIETKDLPITRITECCFECPDGSALKLDFDLCGNPYGEKVIAGPVQGLKAGRNRIKVWEKNICAIL